MSIEEIKSQLKSINPGAIAVCKKGPLTQYYKLYHAVIEMTQFLPPETPFNFRCYYVLNDINELILCKCGCGNPVKNPKKTQYLLGHSNNIDSVKVKKAQTCLQKYGQKNPSQVKKFEQKKVETCLKNYGTEKPAQNKEVVQKMENICLDRYGVRNAFQKNDVKVKIHKNWLLNKDQIVEKMRDSNLTTFYDKLIDSDRLKGKFIPLFTREEYKGVNADKYKFKCLKCGSEVLSDLGGGKIPRCLTCHPLIASGEQSIIERDLVDYVRKFGFDIKVQNRSAIFPLELDIYIPEKNLAIEMDGLYWHSELNGKDKNYHLNKTKVCKANGIRLIHIFEDEWNYKTQIVKNRLKHILGKTPYRIYARKCKIRDISVAVKNKFLLKYHIQGEDRSRIYLGAFYKERLVAVMTFSTLRKAMGNKNIEGEWELCRFCTLGNFSIIGIADKMFKHFINSHKPSKVISYADLRWSEGGLYEKLGFYLSHLSQPNYWYTKDYWTRAHRFNFRKDVLVDKLSIFDPQISEWENMIKNEWDRIWDCGNFIYVWQIEYTNKGVQNEQHSDIINDDTKTTIRLAEQQS
jgi:hypothetical protein